MSTAFMRTRLSIRAVLVASLLVGGHVVLSTAAGLIAALIAGADVDKSERLSSALQIMSTLSALTLLWLSFTSFELTDAVAIAAVPAASTPRVSVDEKRSVEPAPAQRAMAAASSSASAAGAFSRFGVEYMLNAMLLASWIVAKDDALLTVRVLTGLLSPDIAAILVIAMGGAYASLVALQAQLVVSLALYAVRAGPAVLVAGETWAGRSGWWTARIELDAEDEVEEV